MPLQNFFEDYDWEKLGYIKFPKYVVSDFDVEKYGLSKSKTATENMRVLMNRGYAEKMKRGVIPEVRKQEYIDRAKKELDILDNLGFNDYLLIIHAITTYAKETAILSGFGRGSAAGSLVLFLIGVTHTDPIKYNLLFERFVSATRAQKKDFNGETYIESSSLPDVDLDFQMSGKDKIRAFIEKRFPGKCGSISNLSKLTGKALIKEVLKSVEEVSEIEAKHVSDMVEKKYGTVEQISDAIESNEEFKKWAEGHKEAVDIAIKLSDLIKNKSVHASGIILTDEEITKSLPMEYSKPDKETGKSKIASSYDMRDAQKFGIKVDNLGLKTLDVVKKCLDNIKVDLYDISPEDQSIYDYLVKHKEYHGLFQIEKGMGESTVKKIKPKNLEELIACISLGRPGSFKFIDEYKAVKEGKKKIEIHPKLQHILGVTNGIVIYQEQLQEIGRTMANFTLGEADQIRKAIGKKDKPKMLEYKDKFFKGSADNGYEEKFAKKMWGIYEDAADYSFNRCLGLDNSLFSEGLIKPIGDVEAGDCVKSKYKKKIKLTTIKKIYRGKARMVRLLTETGKELVCSLDHKIMVKGGKMKKLIDIIKSGDTIVTYDSNQRCI